MHVNYKSPMNHLGGGGGGSPLPSGPHLPPSHNSPEERGKEHDTSSLAVCDPDKHVYAPGRFISHLNKRLALEVGNLNGRAS